MRYLTSILLLSLLLLLAACGETAAPTSKLTVTRAGDGAGSVVSTVTGSTASSINCSATSTKCSADFAKNTEVILTATADAGSVFTGWSEASCTEASCNVKMDKAKTITATFAIPTTVTVAVNSTSDDAEESVVDGQMYLDSSDLELTTDLAFGSDPAIDQLVGLRFEAVNVPAGATITSAYLAFAVDEASTDTAEVSVTIQAQAGDSPNSFNVAANDISRRELTTEAATWTIAPFTQEEADTHAIKQSSDIAAVLQEVVGRDGWQANNAIVIVISGGTGTRTVESHEGAGEDLNLMPTLVLEYVQ